LLADINTDLYQLADIADININKITTTIKDQTQRTVFHSIY